ncbi:MAG: M23 family metallopeptidase [Treponema sp.]|nr:M23 family metallopeptidase [Treponema sp.]
MMGSREWGVGNRDWGLGTGDWGRRARSVPVAIKLDILSSTLLPTPHSPLPFFLIVLLLLAFSFIVPLAAGAQESTQAGNAEAAVQKPAFALCPENARPGDPVTVGYSDAFGTQGAVPKGLQAVLVDSKGKRLVKAAFFSMPREEGEQELKAAVLAIPSTAVPGNAVIRIESQDGIIRDLPFVIDKRDFFSETIPLDQGNTDLRTKPDPQKTTESEQLWIILSRTGTEIYSAGPFTLPVTSTRRTSMYGDRRVYEYTGGTKDTTIHAGIDFGVPKGTEVRACARGKVVLARPRIVTGNSVVLEHLPGVYSLYYHMDKIAVSEGSVVEAGTLLGLSGSTGLATGPHLHWEIRVSGEDADPDTFLPRPVLDKKEILNKMSVR